MNRKEHLTKHQYLTLSEPNGGPWPELQVSSINKIISPVISRCNDKKGFNYGNNYKPTNYSHPQISSLLQLKFFVISIEKLRYF